MQWSYFFLNIVFLLFYVFIVHFAYALLCLFLPTLFSAVFIPSVILGKNISPLLSSFCLIVILLCFTFDISKLKTPTQQTQDYSIALSNRFQVLAGVEDGSLELRRCKDSGTGNIRTGLMNKQKDGEIQDIQTLPWTCQNQSSAAGIASVQLEG